MREMTQQEWDLVSDAIVVWTGINEFASPHRDESRIPDRLGPDGASELRAMVRKLCDEFDASDARLYAPDLAEMGRMASADFRKKFPRVKQSAVDALAWCYTFDNR